MTRPLLVVPDVEFPIDAVTQKFAWLGRSGSGKTYGAKRFVEEMLRARVQVLIVDSVGVWYGLRLGDSAFSIPVLGGLHGDIALEPTSGALVAETLVETGSSMVLDVSQMTDRQRARFMELLGCRLFELKKQSPGAMHIVLDEAQDFVPQNIMKGVDEMVLHEWVRITKQGRAFGMGLSFCSQRPQEINKKALNQVECVMAFQLTGAHERKALEYWLSDKGVDSKLSRELPSLPIGTPYVWSPQWLQVASVCGQVLPIVSTDTSSTPKVGDAPRSRQQMKAIDLRALRDSMEQMVERVKENDPKLLKQRITELEKQLAGGVDTDVARLGEETRRITEQVECLLQQARAVQQSGSELVNQSIGLVMDVEEKCRDLHRQLDEAVTWLQQPLPEATPAASKPAPTPEAHTQGSAPPARRNVDSRSKLNVTASTGLATGEDAVLKVAYQYGEQGVTRSALIITTGYKDRSIHNYTVALSSAGLVDRPEPGRIRITAKGAALVPKGLKKLPRGKERIKHLIQTLGTGESAVLAHVWRHHPNVVTTAQINEALSQYAPRSIHNYLVSLSGLRAVKRPGKGQVQIHPEALT